VIYYHSSVAAAGSAAAAREILIGRIPANVNVNLNLSLSGRADLVALTPSYTFATPVLGGQLAVGMSGQYGRAAASIAGTLTAIAGPIVVTRTGVLEGSLSSYGDLAPIAQLLWNYGVNNYMAYVTGNIPGGDYDPMRLPNIGLGHGAIDMGGAYTYLDQTTGVEFSGVAGFTYNFKNPDTQYRSGIDFHFDWAHRTSSPSSFSSALLATPTSKSPMIPVRTRSSVASGHAFSVSVHKSDTASRSETCRASWA
jgi:hypothetical protein